MFDESTRCVAFGGKLLVVGFAGGRIAEVSTNIPLIKGFSVVGVRAGEYTRRFPERGARIRAEVAALVADGTGQAARRPRAAAVSLARRVRGDGPARTGRESGVRAGGLNAGDQIAAMASSTRRLSTPSAILPAIRVSAAALAAEAAVWRISAMAARSAAPILASAIA